jgi:hypothetical protein
VVISRVHEYLFVELPNTASTAIRRELCEHYDGVPVLHKHAYYIEFLSVASAKEKEYFVFSCIRNPLDIAVTLYCKYKTDHKGFYSDPKKTKAHAPLPRAALRRYDFIHNTDASFPAFLRRFYRFPYDNWSSLSHHKFDFVIRFENLQDDFAQVLELIGIEQKRPLPTVNPTQEKDDFLSYYTPEVYDHAKAVFGPFMKKWGYGFPSEWGEGSVSLSSQMQYRILGFLRRHSEWSTSFYAPLLRRLLDSSGL